MRMSGHGVVLSDVLCGGAGCDVFLGVAVSVLKAGAGLVEKFLCKDNGEGGLCGVGYAGAQFQYDEHNLVPFCTTVHGAGCNQPWAAGARRVQPFTPRVRGDQRPTCRASQPCGLQHGDGDAGRRPGLDL